MPVNVKRGLLSQMHRYTINHKATLAISRADINLLTAPACTFSRLKNARPVYMPAKCIFDGSITTLLSILRILVEVLSCAHAKRGKSLDDFKSGTSVGCF